MTVPPVTLNVKGPVTSDTMVVDVVDGVVVEVVVVGPVVVMDPVVVLVGAVVVVSPAGGVVVVVAPPDVGGVVFTPVVVVGMVGCELSATVVVDRGRAPPPAEEAVESAVAGIASKAANVDSTSVGEFD